MRPLEVPEALSYFYPQPLAFLSVVSPNGSRNAMAVGWLMQASLEPPILAVAVSPAHYTHRLIEQTDVFAISLAGQGQAALIDKLGTTSTPGTDKLSACGVQATAGPGTGCPLIDGAAVHFECRVERRVTVGDHSVFFGRIVAAWAPDTPVRKMDNFGSQRYAPSQPAA